MFGCKKTLAILLCAASMSVNAQQNLDEIIDLKAQAEKERLSIEAGLKTSPVRLANDMATYSKVELEDTFSLLSLSRFGNSFRAKIETNSGVIWVNNRQRMIESPWMIADTFDGGVIITDGKKQKRMILMESEAGGAKIQSPKLNNGMPPMPQMPQMSQQGAQSVQQQYMPPTQIMPR